LITGACSHPILATSRIRAGDFAAAAPAEIRKRMARKFIPKISTSSGMVEGPIAK
jgi:hypothetical protein